MIIHVLEHALTDTLKLIPFLFLTYCLMEYLEHKTQEQSKKLIKKAGKLGPFIGTVTRPNYVKVKAYNENMEEYILEGTELLARAICHETDHLHGKMYTELVEGELRRTNYEEDDE